MEYSRQNAANNMQDVYDAYKGASLDEISAAYNKYAAHLDQMLEQAQALLSQGEAEAGRRAKFEKGEARTQAGEFRKNADVGTVKDIATAAQFDRSGKADKTLRRAQSEYDVIGKKTKAAADSYKARAALQTASNKTNVRLTAAQAQNKAAADAYSWAIKDREFERQKELDAYANKLADRKYAIQADNAALQREELEAKKQLAQSKKLYAAKQTVLDMVKTDDEGNSYYDLNGDDVASDAEKQLYKEDDAQQAYRDLLKQMKTAESLDSVNKLLEDMTGRIASSVQQKFQANVNKVTEQIASWDNYAGFNDEYAAQLYKDAGVDEKYIDDAVKNAKAQCFINNYAPGAEQNRNNITLGERKSDGSFSNEAFYRDGLKNIGLSKADEDAVMNGLIERWNAQYELIDEMQVEIEMLEQRKGPMRKTAQEKLKEMDERGEKIYKQASDALEAARKDFEIQKQLAYRGQTEAGSNKYFEAQRRVFEAEDKFEKMKSDLQRYRLTGSGGYADFYNHALAEEYRSADSTIEGQQRQLRNTIYNLTTGGGYGAITQVLEDKLGKDQVDRIIDKFNKGMSESAAGGINAVNDLFGSDEFSSLKTAIISTLSEQYGLNISDKSNIRGAVNVQIGFGDLSRGVSGFTEDEWKAGEIISKYLNYCCNIKDTEEILAARDSGKWGFGNGFWDSVGAALGQWITSIPAAVSNMVEWATQRDVDYTDPDAYIPYNYSNMSVYNKRAGGYLEWKTEDIRDKYGDFAAGLFNFGTNILTNVSNAALSGVASVILPVSGSVVGAAMFSAMSFNDSFERALENGASYDSAMLQGVVSGFAEFAFEKWSIEKLFKGIPEFIKGGTLKENAKLLAKKMALNALAEGSEELNTEIANVLSEALILQESSDYAIAVKAYMEDGNNEQQAKRLAMWDMILRVAEAFASGAASGLLLGGGVTFVSNLATNHKLSKSGKINNANISNYIEQGLATDENTDAHKIAQKLNEQIQRGQKPSNRQIGELVDAVHNAAVKTVSENRASGLTVDQAISNLESGTDLTRSMNAFMPGNGANRAAFEQKTGIKLGNTPEAVQAALMSYAHEKSGKSMKELQAALNEKSPGNEANLAIERMRTEGSQQGKEVADAVQYLFSDKGQKIQREEAERAKDGQNPINGEYQNLIAARNTLQNNAEYLSAMGYEITKDAHGFIAVMPVGDSGLANAAKAVQKNSGAKDAAGKTAKNSQESESKKIDNATKYSYNDNESEGVKDGGKEKQAGGRNGLGGVRREGSERTDSIHARSQSQAGGAAQVQGQRDGSKMVEALAKRLSELVRRENHRRTGVRAQLLDAKATETLKRKGITPIVLSKTVKQLFYHAIGAAKKSNPFGAFVEQHSVEDYGDMLLLMGDNSRVGVAITKDGNIVSVYKNSSSKVRGAVSSILLTAIENGGVKLDNFDGRLSDLYGQHGFIPVARTAFVDEFAPSDWNYERDGRPDIVFWVHNGETAQQVADKIGTYETYYTSEVPMFGSYDEAEAYRDKIIEDAMSTDSSAVGIGRAQKDAAGKAAKNSQESESKKIDNATKYSYNDIGSEGVKNGGKETGAGLSVRAGDSKADRLHARAQSQAGDDATVQGRRVGAKVNKILSSRRAELVRRENHLRTGVRAKLLDAKTAETLKQKGKTPIVLSKTVKQLFYHAIGAAKRNNPFGAFVEQHSVEDYGDMLLLMGDNSRVGVAITKDGNIVSVYKNSSSKVRGAVSSILLTAIENGGVKLDNFNSRDLSKMYMDHGFIPVARTAFVDEFAPSDWNYERDGRPDIVFWVHNGETAQQVADKIGTYETYYTSEVPMFGSYDEAEAYRDKIIEDAMSTDSSAVGIGRAQNDADGKTAQNNKDTASLDKKTDTKYRIKKAADGSSFVDVDTDILSGVDVKDIPHVLSDIIKNKFHNLITVNGQKIGINQKTAREWQRSKSAQNLYKNKRNVYEDKLRTLNNADEILQAARDWIGEGLRHVRKDSFVEFARGTVDFRVGSNGYAADVIVGVTGDQKTYLYDLVGIKSKKIIDVSGYITSQGVTLSDSTDTSIEDSISQKNETVNSNNMQNEKRYAKTISKKEIDEAMRGAAEKTTTRKDGTVVYVQAKNVDTQDVDFPKGRQIYKTVQRDGQTSSYYFVEADTSEIHSAEMLDAMNGAKAAAKTSGARNVHYYVGDLYVNGELKPALGFRSMDGEVYIRIAEGDVMASTIGHEVYHQMKSIEGGKHVKAFESTIKDLLQDSSEAGGRARAAFNRIKNDYQEQFGSNFSDDAVFEELCAEYCGQAITDAAVARAIAARDSSVGNILRRFIAKILNKLTGNAEYNELIKNLSAADKAIVEAIRATKGEQGQGSETKLRIETEPTTGKSFVSIPISDIVGDGIDQADSISRKARLYLKQKFKGVVLPVGKTKSAYIRAEGINETTNPAKILEDSDYRGKMLAVTELDNLLKSGEYIGWHKDDGRHADVLRWLNYRTTFLFYDEQGNAQVLEGVIKIKRIERGDCYYDITEIKNITNGNFGQAIVSYAAKSIGDIVNDSIPQKSETVNSNNMQNENKYAKTISEKEIGEQMRGAAEKTTTRKDGTVVYVQAKNVDTQDVDFPKGRQIYKTVQRDGQTSSYYFVEADTSEIHSAEMLDAINSAKAAAKAIGARNVHYYVGDLYVNGKLETVLGFYSMDGEIYVRMGNGDVMASTIGHEVYHQMKSIEGGKHVKSFENAIKDLLQDGSEAGGRARAAFNRIKNDYQEQFGSNFSDDAVFEELCAEYCGQAITDAAVARAIAARDSSVGNILRRFIAKILNKLMGNAEYNELIKNLSAADKAIVEAIRETKGKQGQGSETKMRLIGVTDGGESVYISNYPAGTDKYVKAENVIDLVQNIWSRKDISLKVFDSQENKYINIKAKFNPELGARTDLSKIAFGNRNGNAREKRITTDLNKDFYDIAQKSKPVGSKSETGKDNPAHIGVDKWYYNMGNLWYLSHDKKDLYPMTANINIKRTSDGYYFYGYSIEDREIETKIRNADPLYMLAQSLGLPESVPDDVIIHNISENVNGKISGITEANKIRSVDSRSHNLDTLLSDDKILYLDKNKDRADTGFQTIGRSTPFGGTEYGSIKNIVSQELAKSQDGKTKLRLSTGDKDLDALRDGIDKGQNVSVKRWTEKFRTDEAKNLRFTVNAYGKVPAENKKKISAFARSLEDDPKNIKYVPVNIGNYDTYIGAMHAFERAGLMNDEVKKFFLKEFGVQAPTASDLKEPSRFLISAASSDLHTVAMMYHMDLDTAEAQDQLLKMYESVMQSGFSSQAERQRFKEIMYKSESARFSEDKVKSAAAFMRETKLKPFAQMTEVDGVEYSDSGISIEDAYKQLQTLGGKELFEDTDIAGMMNAIEELMTIAKVYEMGGDAFSVFLDARIDQAFDSFDMESLRLTRIANGGASNAYEGYAVYDNLIQSGRQGIRLANEKLKKAERDIERILTGVRKEKGRIPGKITEYWKRVEKFGFDRADRGLYGISDAEEKAFHVQQVAEIYHERYKLGKELRRARNAQDSAAYTFLNRMIKHSGTYKKLPKPLANIISLENAIKYSMGEDAAAVNHILSTGYAQHEAEKLKAKACYRGMITSVLDEYKIDPNSKKGAAIGQAVQLIGEGWVEYKNGRYVPSKKCFSAGEQVYQFYRDKKTGEMNVISDVRLEEMIEGKKSDNKKSKARQYYNDSRIDIADFMSSFGQTEMAAVTALDVQFRKIYQNLFYSLNESLLENGYSPVNETINYYPHFTSENGAIGKVLSRLTNVFNDTDDLPAHLQGKTADRKPGKKWFAHALERSGESTAVNAFIGFERYISGATDIIYHTGDIRLRRKLAALLGGKDYSKTWQRLYALNEPLIFPDEVLYDDLAWNNSDDIDPAAKLLKDLLDGKTAKNIGLIYALNENANMIAGKQSAIDRTFENLFGRGFVRALGKLNSMVGSAMVAMNLRSALTNLITLPQLTGTVNPLNVGKAIAQVAFVSRSELNALHEQSAFLQSRFINTDESILQGNKFKRAVNKIGGFAMDLSDTYTARVVWTAYYNEAKSRGMYGADVIEFADAGARNLMASRVKGEMPPLFHSKVLGVFTMFQLENTNMIRYFLQDIPASLRSNRFFAAKIIGKVIGSLFAEWIFELFFEWITGSKYRVWGSNPVTIVADLIGDVQGGKNFEDAVKEAGKGFLSDIPVVGTFITEGRYGTQNQFKAWGDLAGSLWGVTGSIARGDLTAADLSNLGSSVLKAAPVPGAGQVRKAYEGLLDMIRGGRYYSGYYTDDEGAKVYGEQLAYATNQDNFGNWLRGFLFGRSSIAEANEFWDKGFTKLSVQQSAQYKEAVASGLKNTWVYDTYKDASKLYTEISAHNKKEEKKAKEEQNKRSYSDEIRDRIIGYDITPQQKQLLWTQLSKKDEPGDINKYMQCQSDFSSNVTYQKLSDEGKQRVLKMLSMPTIAEAGALKKATAVGVKEKDYALSRQYLSELKDAKADRKSEYLKYLNKANATNTEKMLLLRLAGYSISEKETRFGYTKQSSAKWIADAIRKSGLSEEEKLSLARTMNYTIEGKYIIITVDKQKQRYKIV